MFRLFELAAIACLASLCGRTVAADGTSVTISYSDYVNELAHVVGSLTDTIFPVTVALLPAPVRLVISAIFDE